MTIYVDGTDFHLELTRGRQAPEVVISTDRFAATDTIAGSIAGSTAGSTTEHMFGSTVGGCQQIQRSVDEDERGPDMSMTVTRNQSDVNNLVGVGVPRFRARAQRRLNRLSSSCVGLAVDEITPKVERLLADNDIRIDRRTAWSYAEIISEGGWVTLK